MRLHGADPSYLYGGSYSDDDLQWWVDRLMPLVRMVKNGVAEYQEFSAIERFTL